jgi:hypothetical protein
MKPSWIVNNQKVDWLRPQEKPDDPTNRIAAGKKRDQGNTKKKYGKV